MLGGMMSVMGTVHPFNGQYYMPQKSTTPSGIWGLGDTTWVTTHAQAAISNKLEI